MEDAPKPANASKSVDGFIRKNKNWAELLTALRRIALDSGLTEDVKWRVPAYTFEGNNVLLFVVLKEYVGLSFPKGSLLKDAKGLLVTPGQNTRAAKFFKFTSAAEVATLEPTIRAYIAEAIEVERAGLKVDFKASAALPVPAEARAIFDAQPKLKAAFDALTPGRQRAYLLHFNGAKQSKTRTARVEKHAPRILAGKGLDDE